MFSISRRSFVGALAAIPFVGLAVEGKEVTDVYDLTFGASGNNLVITLYSDKTATAVRNGRQLYSAQNPFNEKADYCDDYGRCGITFWVCNANEIVIPFAWFLDRAE